MIFKLVQMAFKQLELTSRHQSKNRVNPANLKLITTLNRTIAAIFLLNETVQRFILQKGKVPLSDTQMIMPTNSLLSNCLFN